MVVRKNWLLCLGGIFFVGCGHDSSKVANSDSAAQLEQSVSDSSGDRRDLWMWFSDPSESCRLEGGKQIQKCALIRREMKALELKEVRDCENQTASALQSKLATIATNLRLLESQYFLCLEVIKSTSIAETALLTIQKQCQKINSPFLSEIQSICTNWPLIHSE